MRKFILILAIFCLPFYSALAQDDGWLIAKSTHFIVYYKNAPSDFIERLIEKAEEYYDKIADNLGFRRNDFWLWDNRAKIYIDDDAEDYQAATGQPAWSMGAAIPKDKVIRTFPGIPGFFETTLPHEMGHIIFREFVGFDNNALPLWLDEGVASYQENFRHLTANRLVRKAIENDKFINLEALSKLNPQKMQDKELVNIFYAEAVSIIDYLVKEFSEDNFVRFCYYLRDTKNLQKSITSAYPFRNMQELDQAWQRYLKYE